jgi:hypothetical protein
MDFDFGSVIHWVSANRMWIFALVPIALVVIVLKIRG